MKITCTLWELLPTAVNEALEEQSRAGGISKIQALSDLCMLALESATYGIEPVGEPIAFVPPPEKAAPLPEVAPPEKVAEAEEPVAESEEGLPTVKELRTSLQEMGLPIEGTRQELAERLDGADPFEGFNFEGGVGTRLENILRSNFTTLKELLDMPEKEVREIRGLGGGKTLDLLNENLASLRGEEPPAAVEEVPDILDFSGHFYEKYDVDPMDPTEADVTKACTFYMNVLDLSREEAREDVSKILSGVFVKSDSGTFGLAIDAVLGALPADHYNKKQLDTLLRDKGVSRAEANDRAILLFGHSLSELTNGEVGELCRDIQDVVQVGEDFAF